MHRLTPEHVALELQALARDRAVIERLERLERHLARVHARLDGAMVTFVPRAERDRPDQTSGTPDR